MQPVVFIARVIGPLFVVLGIGVLVNERLYADMIGEAVLAPILIYLTGLLAFTAGVAMLNEMCIRDSRGDGGARRPVGDVERERFRNAAGGADRRHCLRGGVAVDVERGDAGALAGKAERDGAADPRTGPGHGSDCLLYTSRCV